MTAPSQSSWRLPLPNFPLHSPQSFSQGPWLCHNTAAKQPESTQIRLKALATSDRASDRAGCKLNKRKLWNLEPHCHLQNVAEDGHMLRMEHLL